MVRLLGLGIVVQILTCAAIGVRLLWLARRTRKLPELAFGVGFLALGAVGYPLSIAARAGAASPEVAGHLLLAALIAQDVACYSVAIGTWRTFFPYITWLRGVMASVAVGFVASLVGHALTVGFHGAHDGGAWYYVGFSLRFAAFVWAFVAAFDYASRIRLQVGLGMADPVVADRIRLWAITCACICVGFAIFLAGRITGVNVGESPPILVTTSLVSIAASATMGLAFFPPRVYLDRVKRLAAVSVLAD